MAAIICRQCGYENPEGSTVCEICAESLVEETKAPVQAAAVAVSGTPVNAGTTVSQISTAPQEEAAIDDGNEYFILCPESQTKTILPHGKVTSFYCEGCKKQHEVDGFLWNIEKRAKQEVSAGRTETQKGEAPKGDNLWLEEINSHVRIEIDRAGGSLGRYGKYGAEFFQSRGLLTVSGEHCMITYEFGNWVIRHISRTNQTKYNNMILGSNEPNLLEDGKALTLANAVTFIVRIG
ncbi:MAG: FHA domain-containing protein [Blautia sp.]|nr:FHA domain-containing protein [Lachnoclostridium sp.]MCM1211551.1 FHA domain-containing protein [Blautia sp.]